MYISLVKNLACRGKTISSNCKMLWSGRESTDALHELPAQHVRRNVQSRNHRRKCKIWIQQGNEQEQRDRAAGVKALFGMLATTTSGRAKEIVKQGFSDRNGMIS